MPKRVPAWNGLLQRQVYAAVPGAGVSHRIYASVRGGAQVVIVINRCPFVRPVERALD